LSRLLTITFTNILILILICDWNILFLIQTFRNLVLWRHYYKHYIDHVGHSWCRYELPAFHKYTWCKWYAFVSVGLQHMQIYCWGPKNKVLVLKWYTTLPSWMQLVAVVCRYTVCYSSISVTLVPYLLCLRPVGEGGGIKRWSASVVRPSVCLMSRTSALTRKPKGLGRWNFAQVTCDSHTDFKVKSQGHGAGAYCGGYLAAQLVNTTVEQYLSKNWLLAVYTIHRGLQASVLLLILFQALTQTEMSKRNPWLADEVFSLVICVCSVVTHHRFTVCLSCACS